ncbi:MAG: YciI family protein [Acidimicrobiales bacterium]
MTNFVFTYHGGSGMPESKEEQDQIMAAWGVWMGGLGAKLIDGGNPFAAHKTVAPDGAVSDGGPASTLSGYSVVSADSFEEAVDMAKGCPVLTSGGQVQVSETIVM